MMLDSKQVAMLMRCSHHHLVSRLRHRAGFPKPSPIHKRPLMWRECDINDYLGV